MMQLPPQVLNINKKLVQLYGKHLDGRPYFRLSWPRDQREHRFGDFTYTLPGTGIVTKVETNVIRERLKYSYLPERWILEVLSFPEKPGVWGPELHGVENGSYECIWCFNFEEYRIPEFDAVQALVKIALYGSESKKLNASDFAAIEKMEFDKEVQEVFEILDDASPDLAHALKHGEAVFIKDLTANQEKSNEGDSGIVLSGGSTRDEAGVTSSGIQNSGE